MKNLKSILTNKVLLYLVSRYATYFVQFVSSMIIAAKLGPYYFGIWGFILLLLNYFQQCHFGISNSFNVLYVHHKDNKQECDNYTANSLALFTYLCIAVSLFYVYYLVFGISGFEKYNVDKYVIWVCIIAIFQYYQNFLINLFRVKNDLLCVIFCQSVVVLLNFICVLFFTGEVLIDTLIGGYVIGNASCILLAFCTKVIPSPAEIKLNWGIQSEILKKGIFLFLYNSCFYFIIISIRTIISSNYTVEEFGLFSFSYTLTNALMLILEALLFIIFPKLIGKLSSDNNEEVDNTIRFLRTSYVSSVHLLIYIAILLFPVVLKILPQYQGALKSMNLISLSLLMHAHSCGYIELLISRNKEKLSALLSASALVINCVLAILIVYVWQASFSYVILATLVTYLFFSVSAMYCGRKIVGKLSVKEFIAQYFPVRLLIPYCSALALSLMDNNDLLFLPLVLYIMLNIPVVRQIIDTIRLLIKRPEVINL